ncbi:uncharacterized protein B0I36DRAFT_364465 [Microdochium trichocladiopsis]|uniref:Zn(2)-C6 fungal-type domain-containing protein n=1 Tax=Microdochium trichocladiopsis TaxID=1682393 RepID=A0A9P8Y1K9_9PEZI|nr:uncharacterized protein B0I36DRAFT_364465 [Microdochium trichocladiopsis]KAH7027228.1 hypothetical protein B0I36DRAFT_364465 [Microdochium trichocladiopsis]
MADHNRSGGHFLHQPPSPERLAPAQQLPSLAPRQLEDAGGAGPSQAGIVPGPGAATSKPLFGRRRKVVAACDTCRNRKAKCDGTRPRCNTCITNGRECRFFTQPDESRQAATRRHQANSQEQLQQLKASHDALQDLVYSLVAQHDAAEIHRILSQVRRGSHPAFVPSSVSAQPGQSQGHGLAGGGVLGNQHEQRFREILTASTSAATAAPDLHPPSVSPSAATTTNSHRRTSSASSKRKRNETTTLYEELFELLVSTTHDDALSIVQRLRRTGDVSAVLGQAKEADLLLQLSLIPETRRRYDLPTRNDMPEFLLTVDNPYLESLIHETQFKLGSTTSPMPALTQAAANHAAPGSTIVHYVTPFGSAQLHEPIINELRPSQWTSVLSDDVVLRRLLRSYFLYDYQNYPAFHKDLFLQDMKHGRRRFCSPLLVNAVLAAGAHADAGIPNSDKFWLPQGLGYRFLAEAKRLWEMEDYGKSRLTTVQAAIILNAISLSDATDKIGKAFMLQAVAMADEMKLLTTRDEDIPKQSMRKARAFTAWCLFGWDVIQSYFFFKRPMFPGPPLCELPGADDTAWYGDLWLWYPGEHERLVPSHAGAVLKASMGLRVIQHAIACAFFERPEGSPAPSGRQIEQFQHQLYRWFDALPESISPKNTVLPMHLRLHMEYYTGMITLARVQPAPTEVGSSDEQADPSSLPTPPRSVMQDPMAQALARLETLVRIYHIRHGIDFYDSSMTYYFAFLGTFIIQALGAYYEAMASADPLPPAAKQVLPTPVRLEAYRSALIMCAKGLHEQGKSTYVCQVTYYILRGSMAPRERDMVLAHVKEHSAATTPGEVTPLMGSGSDIDDDEDNEHNDDERGAGVEIGSTRSESGSSKQRRAPQRHEEEDSMEMRIYKYNQSHFPMPIISITEDPRDATLVELAGRYRRMSLDGSSSKSTEDGHSE